MTKKPDDEVNFLNNDSSYENNTGVIMPKKFKLPTGAVYIGNDTWRVERKSTLKELASYPANKKKPVEYDTYFKYCNMYTKNPTLINKGLSYPDILSPGKTTVMKPKFSPDPKFNPSFSRKASYSD